ncbi:unnamed protein product [Orchesella dallaii]|uniref:Uncharacterized protein n=1 Tax=Orchesella dallaii TaxID=48710 RepID=A0ABP1R9M5_9HEXA
MEVGMLPKIRIISDLRKTELQIPAKYEILSTEHDAHIVSPNMAILSNSNVSSEPVHKSPNESSKLRYAGYSASMNQTRVPNDTNSGYDEDEPDELQKPVNGSKPKRTHLFSHQSPISKRRKRDTSTQSQRSAAARNYFTKYGQRNGSGSSKNPLGTVKRKNHPNRNANYLLINGPRNQNHTAHSRRHHHRNHTKGHRHQNHHHRKHKEHKNKNIKPLGKPHNHLNPIPKEQNVNGTKDPLGTVRKADDKDHFFLINDHTNVFENGVEAMIGREDTDRNDYKEKVGSGINNQTIIMKEVTTKKPSTAPNTAEKPTKAPEIPKNEFTTKKPSTGPNTAEKPTKAPEIPKNEVTTKKPSTTPNIPKKEVTTEKPTTTPNIPKKDVTTEKPSTSPNILKKGVTTKKPTKAPDILKKVTTQKPTKAPNILKKVVTTQKPTKAPNILKKEVTTQKPTKAPDILKKEVTTKKPSTTPKINIQAEIDDILCQNTSKSAQEVVDEAMLKSGKVKSVSKKTSYFVVLDNVKTAEQLEKLLTEQDSNGNPKGTGKNCNNKVVEDVKENKSESEDEHKALNLFNDFYDKIFEGNVSESEIKKYVGENGISEEVEISAASSASPEVIDSSETFNIKGRTFSQAKAKKIRKMKTVRFGFDTELQELHSGVQFKQINGDKNRKAGSTWWEPWNDDSSEEYIDSSEKIWTDLYSALRRKYNADKARAHSRYRASSAKGPIRPRGRSFHGDIGSVPNSITENGTPLLTLGNSKLSNQKGRLAGDQVEVVGTVDDVSKKMQNFNPKLMKLAEETSGKGKSSNYANRNSSSKNEESAWLIPSEASMNYPINKSVTDFYNAFEKSDENELDSVDSAVSFGTEQTGRVLVKAGAKQTGRSFEEAGTEQIGRVLEKAKTDQTSGGSEKAETERVKAEETNEGLPLGQNYYGSSTELNDAEISSARSSLLENHHLTKEESTKPYENNSYILPQTSWKPKPTPPPSTSEELSSSDEDYPNVHTGEDNFPYSSTNKDIERKESWFKGQTETKNGNGILKEWFGATSNDADKKLKDEQISHLEQLRNPENPTKVDSKRNYSKIFFETKKPTWNNEKDAEEAKRVEEHIISSQTARTFLFENHNLSKEKSTNPVKNDTYVPPMTSWKPKPMPTPSTSEELSSSDEDYLNSPIEWNSEGQKETKNGNGILKEWRSNDADKKLTSEPVNYLEQGINPTNLTKVDSNNVKLTSERIPAAEQDTNFKTSDSNRKHSKIFFKTKKPNWDNENDAEDANRLEENTNLTKEEPKTPVKNNTYLPARTSWKPKPTPTPSTSEELSSSDEDYPNPRTIGVTGENDFPVSSTFKGVNREKGWSKGSPEAKKGNGILKEWFEGKTSNDTYKKLKDEPSNSANVTKVDSNNKILDSEIFFETKKPNWNNEKDSEEAIRLEDYTKSSQTGRAFLFENHNLTKEESTKPVKNDTYVPPITSWKPKSTQTPSTSEELSGSNEDYPNPRTVDVTDENRYPYSSTIKDVNREKDWSKGQTKTRNDNQILKEWVERKVSNGADKKLKNETGTSTNLTKMDSSKVNLSSERLPSAEQETNNRTLERNGKDRKGVVETKKPIWEYEKNLKATKRLEERPKNPTTRPSLFENHNLTKAGPPKPVKNNSYTPPITSWKPKPKLTLSTSEEQSNEDGLNPPPTVDLSPSIFMPKKILKVKEWSSSDSTNNLDRKKPINNATHYDKLTQTQMNRANSMVNSKSPTNIQQHREQPQPSKVWSSFSNPKGFAGHNKLPTKMQQDKEQQRRSKLWTSFAKQEAITTTPPPKRKLKEWLG